MGEALSFEPITIRPHPDGGYDVRVGDRTAGALCFGEMLEQVVALTLGERRPRSYPMQTEAEWTAWLRRPDRGDPDFEEVE